MLNIPFVDLKGKGVTINQKRVLQLIIWISILFQTEHFFSTHQLQVASIRGNIGWGGGNLWGWTGEEI